MNKIVPVSALVVALSLVLVVPVASADSFSWSVDIKPQPMKYDAHGWYKVKASTTGVEKGSSCYFWIKAYSMFGRIWGFGWFVGSTPRARHPAVLANLRFDSVQKPWPSSSEAAGDFAILAGTARVRGFDGVKKLDFSVILYPEEGYFSGDGPSAGFRFFDEDGICIYHAYGPLESGDISIEPIELRGGR